MIHIFSMEEIWSTGFSLFHNLEVLVKEDEFDSYTLLNYRIYLLYYKNSNYTTFLT